MAYIKSAYFGDEKSMRNVTESILDKISGGRINVLADNSLVPMFETTVALTDSDKQDARDEAIQKCGGNANDQDCIDGNLQRIEQRKLEEKENQTVSKANIIKGRRLTVNVVDETGRTRTLLVPDGQYFKLDNLRLDATGSTVKLPDGDSTWKYFVFLFSTILYWLFQTFATVGAYRTLNGYSYIQEFAFTYDRFVINLPLVFLLFTLFMMPFGGILGLLIMFGAPLLLGEPNLAQ